MKIEISKDELEYIIKKHYSDIGLEVESLSIEAKETPILITKDYNPKTNGELKYERIQSFKKQYYKTFGENAPYPFGIDNPNKPKGFSIGVYGVKSNWM